MFLKQTLVEIAMNAEEKAEFMRTISYLNPNVVMYERFDASHGVSNFKLDDYQALDQIKAKTILYLEEQATVDLLEEVGLAIATDYINNNPTVGRHAQTNNAAIAEPHNPTFALDGALASSLLSTDSASHGSSSNGGPHLLSPPSDEPYTNGLLALTGQQEGTLHQPNWKEHAVQYVDEDPDVKTKALVALLAA